jgi:lysophospholipase L1-like esterase
MPTPYGKDRVVDMIKMKNLFINFSILILALVITFMITEFVIRLIYKDEKVLFPRYHTDVKYGQFTLRRIRPDSEFWHTSPDGSWEFIINKQGFRNYRDFEYNKPEGTIRIISLGDSNTQGYEVRQDYTFSAIIEKYLDNQGYDVEVMNAGVSGFSTAEELLFLENEGIKYKPDFVVLGFFANDFEDNIKANFFRLEQNGNLLIQKTEHIPGVKIQNIIYEIPMVKWLSENSYFYSLLFNNTWNYFKARLSKKASAKVMEYAIPTQDEFTDYQSSLTSALIKRMYNFCHKNNIKLIIMDIPKITAKNRFKTSFSVSLLQTIMNYSDGYVVSDSLLDDYAGVAEIFLPHGHRHISEFTHTLLGVSVAKKIRLLIQ